MSVEPRTDGDMWDDASGRLAHAPHDKGDETKEALMVYGLYWLIRDLLGVVNNQATQPAQQWILTSDFYSLLRNNDKPEGTLRQTVEKPN